MSGRVDIEMLGDDTMAGGNDGSDSWMISYLDVLTLIIAFFVLMLSLSEPISEEEERSDGTGDGGPTVLAGEGSSVLAGGSGLLELNSRDGEPQLAAAGQSEATSSEAEQTGAGEQQAPPGEEDDSNASPVDSSLARGAPDNAAEQRLMESLEALQTQGVEVIAADDGITIRLAEGLLFTSGQAELTAEGLLLLEELEDFLLLFEGQISVEGHTDSFPIRSDRFASNWELSAARAIAVVQFLAEGALSADRLRAVGYAATQPLERNITEEGRAANRRVEMILQTP